MNIEATIKNNFPVLIDPALLAEMERYCTTKTLEAGYNFIEIGDQVVAMPLLLEGVIKVVREDDAGNELLLYYLNGGDTCASTLSCCMEQARSEVRATVIERVTALMVPIRCLEEWMRKYAGWRSFIMQSYRLRFEELLQTIDSIAFKKMDERLVEYLIQLSEERNTTTLLGTHQEIADDLHTSREVVSRLLKQLERLGKVRLSRNKIELLKL
ncbi:MULTISPECIES: Crp/Fnr family transcriptional regulator [unclassified Carboxylicivirga]|uniref:Crp/Fnr family transcriptional regulator n=1 Tax=Carboxylicivirga TaxID=1628153 RepID=UPI003D34E1B8